MSDQIDSPEAWRVTAVATAIAAVSLGAPYIVIVALKQIAADLGGLRSIPSAAASLAMLGTGVGGLIMGWVADRIGIRATVMFGALMVCAGLTLASHGQPWQLYVGYGLFAGLIGNGAINAPLYVYVTRWFERRRGTALALIASGQYLAGAAWPPLFERAIAAYGWRETMAGFGVLVAAVVVPVAFVVLKPAPEQPAAASGGAADGRDRRVLGLPANLTFALLAGASFLCCVPMAMPTAHLIALCGDLGLTPSRGALMLTVLLSCAFVSRQLWGWVSDRIGGLLTLLVGSAAQATVMAAFIVTQDELGLLMVSAAFGLGFSGLIPAYVLTARHLFPAREASWRIPTLLLTGMSGMATGSWLAGVLYDTFGFYAAAFGVGLGFNVVNLVVIAALVARWRQTESRVVPA